MSGLQDYVRQGGAMMWPLMACSAGLLAVLIERFWTVGVRRWMLRRPVPRRRLLWHRRALVFFEEVPPSLGLLGTVIGVVQSFGLTGGRITAESAGAGLAVACFTTVAGLAVAITALVARHVLDALAGGQDGEPC